MTSYYRGNRGGRVLIRERLFAFTSRDFAVKEGIWGRPIFTIEGDYVSMHDRRTLYNATGRSVYRMKSKMISAHGNMRIKDCRTSVVLATVRRGSVVPMAVRGGGHVRVWRGENTDMRPWLEIDGEHNGNAFAIYDAYRKTEAAFVERKSFNLAALFGKSSYVLNVKRGYDMPLMIMLTLAIDDYYR